MANAVASEAQAFAYAEITKAEKQEDGSLVIYGRPSKEELDVDQQIADKEWLKQALPGWFQWGNIREMHAPSAVGAADKLEFDENDDPWIRAKIVDPVAIKKIESGVYKGLSIGIKRPVIKRDPQAPGGRIVGGEIVEISVVDRPAVPSAKFDVMKKMAGGDDEWLDCQTGFVLKAAKSGEDEEGPYDEEGNPILQPGHPRDADEPPIEDLLKEGDEPVVLTQDSHSVTVQVGRKIYRMPWDMDEEGNIIIGDPEDVTPWEEKGVSTTGTKAAKTLRDAGLSFERLQNLAKQRMDIEHMGQDHWHYVEATYPDLVIVSCGWEDGAQLYAVPFEILDTADGDADEDDYRIGDPYPVETRYVPKKTDDEKSVRAVLMKTVDTLGKSVWSTEYINDLPDSAFAYIEPGGKKDDEGKTTPRSLRHLPYKDKDGKIDPAHVRNALAHLDQTDISDEAKAEARRKLIAAAKEVGIEVSDEKNKETEKATVLNVDDLIKVAASEAVKAAMDVANGQKVLCQQCKKTVTITKSLDGTELTGGVRVKGIADCGHTVHKFVKDELIKADKTEKKGDKEDEKKPDEKSEGKDGEKKPEMSTKPDEEKAAPPQDEPVKEPDGRDEDPDKKRQDDEIEKRVRAVLVKMGILKDANPDDTARAEETSQKLIRDLRDAHKALGDRIEECAMVLGGDAGKAANPAGGPSRVEGADPREMIAALKKEVRRLMDMIEDGEREMGHSDREPTKPNLGDDPVPPASKPRGDGKINFTEGDFKAVVADVVKSMMADHAKAAGATSSMDPVDLGKAVGEVVKGVLEPLVQRLDRVEHMAQPNPFVFEAEKFFAMNGDATSSRADALKNVREEMSKLAPKDQERVLAAAIAKARGWA
ncbi:hypothetical protein [Alicyclobacillus sendaiensis]|uniref:hypothetical protein n=1 Tax=Alicyclobacillus sendaiensis TaxID=192387 RepID=UPI0026F410DB|nr:hypothetical protein [Alicyclobacillus sendaiensis]